MQITGRTFINLLKETLSLIPPPSSQPVSLFTDSHTLSDRACVSFHSDGGPRQLNPTEGKTTRQTGLNPTVSYDETLEGRRAGLVSCEGNGGFGSDVGVSQ